YDVECGGRGGIYGTLAPPIFSIPDRGISAQIGLPPPPPGSSGSASGFPRFALPSTYTHSNDREALGFLSQDYTVALMLMLPRVICRVPKGRLQTLRVVRYAETSRFYSRTRDC
ncbi:hypothetical protein AVEN_74364-1, partial [Araneus ventricosus]